MIINDIVLGIIESRDLPININELSARTNSKVDLLELNPIIDKFNSVAKYRFAYVKLPLSLNDDICNFEFCSVKSQALSAVLSGCNEAIFIAVSSGIDTDRLISRTNIQSPAQAFMLDAIGSAMIESCADYICNIISKEHTCTKRFSPGYADLPIEFQKDMLNRLNAESTVGITLSDKLMMIPMKSITAVMGIRK